MEDGTPGFKVEGAAAIAEDGTANASPQAPINATDAAVMRLIALLFTVTSFIVRDAPIVITPHPQSADHPPLYSGFTS
ncbi:hypothetical protein CSQ85_04490 [Bifidobacterium rousetti]|nr:hypothetical protein CSQ85_04490 [Bifidobacterium rousetti]